MGVTLFNFHDVVLLMTTYQCALFALLLLFLRRENRLSNALLAGFLITQAAIPLDILINFGAEFRSWAIGFSPDIFPLFGMAYWLEGPVLLWYIRSLIYKDYHLRRSDLFYLLPFAAYAGYQVVVFYSLDDAAKVALLSDHDVLQESALTHAIGFARECLRVAFGVVCVVEIRRCRREIKDTYSNIEKIDFWWLNALIVGFLILRLWAVVVSVGLNLAAHFGVDAIDFAALGLTSNYTVFVLVSVLIFLSLTYSSMFEGIERGNHLSVQREADARIEIDEAQVQRLVDYMQSDKPYLATILTLEQLADQLSMSKRGLSNIINRHFKQNFFEFINHYRIEEAKRLLRDPVWSQRNLLEVMTAAGFNSKATFNTFFKKCEGITPSQYRELSAG